MQNGWRSTAIENHQQPRRTLGQTLHARSRAFPLALLASAWLASSLLLTASSALAEPAERCRDYNPERNLYWGDLHVHTAYSMDAYVFTTRVTPDDAYRFARGETLMLPPLDNDGRGTTPFALERPLDFAAVTDHAHSMGGTRLCTDRSSSVFESETCRLYRTPVDATMADQAKKSVLITERIESLRSEPVCGPDGRRCRDAMLKVWQDTQRAAARWNDTTPECRFSTLVGYEYTLTPNMTKIHRNVIFGSDQVPELPITAFDEPTPLGLWQQLERQCIKGIPGCDVLAIPHNPNLSNGRMFTIEYPDGSSLIEQAGIAQLRARMEPLVEVMQIKGDSECSQGMWKVLGADEECGFENVRADDSIPDCEDGVGWGALAGKGCKSRLDFARYALLEGLREADRIGVNPYPFGMIGSTDIHTGTPGAVDEWATETFDQISGNGYNLGGLAAVWAEENTRESIFSSLRRREVFATSGTRMSVRLFGGWNFSQEICASPNLVEKGYRKGVPMGSDLPRKTGDAPQFVAWAQKDPGTEAHPGTPLQRIQIVKGWADADGTFHQEVVDIAGKSTSGSKLDTQTCTVKGPDVRELCAVWRDPEFDPKKRAVYYARVLEDPSCRYSTRICNRAKKDGTSPAVCQEANRPTAIQERAWTSPIWYSPIN